ncbi:hypothetical protein [Enterobacter hormaechei]|uniref:hypothetical protein n=1 Tax=Enterobacter hormaechei TaxID=158836 RepID=UPI0015D4D272|nr:hypothetical protein [Enterobacter hormaechei]
MKTNITFKILGYIAILIVFSGVLMTLGRFIGEHSLEIIFVLPVIYGFCFFRWTYQTLGKRLKYGNDCMLYAAATIAACALVVNTSIFTIEFFSITMKNVFGYVITTVLATSSMIKLLITYDEYKNS